VATSLRGERCARREEEGLTRQLPDLDRYFARGSDFFDCITSELNGLFLLVTYNPRLLAGLSSACVGARGLGVGAIMSPAPPQ
jgi:hypothetical protein